MYISNSFLTGFGDIASIQTKTSKANSKTFYVVLSINGKHKWLKAGASLSDAKKLKKQVESLERSKQIEKLGLNQETIKIDDFFQQYVDYARLHISKNSQRRHLNILIIINKDG